MYIDIELVSEDRKLIESITKKNNVSYLVKGYENPEYPYLGEVEIHDYSVFFDKDMDAIIEELLRVRKEVSDHEDRAHIDDIVRLAKKCKQIPGTALVFSGV